MSKIHILGDGWWFDRDDDEDGTIYWAVNAPNRFIANVYSNEGDARVIVAIPDLIAACRAVCAPFEHTEDVPLYVRKARESLVKAGYRT